MTIRERYQRRVPQPPPTEDAAVQQWMRFVTDELNALPPLSTFSYITPESNVTAIPGTIGVNLASGVSATWAKQTGDGNTGWVPVA